MDRSANFGKTSAPCRRRIDLFAIDTLVNMLATAGISIELRIHTAA